MLVLFVAVLVIAAAFICWFVPKFGAKRAAIDLKGLDIEFHEAQEVRK